jgi:HEAT repeat protein
MLLSLAADPSQTAIVRARAAGSIEANEPWEQLALVELIGSSRDTGVRVAATQTIGAFAKLDFVLDRLGGLIRDPSAAVRAALLWALQLATRPNRLAGTERARAEAIVRSALDDADPSVRRRAAYVAGNLDASALVPDLIERAREETERADLRLASFVALGEIASGERISDLVFLFLREEDPSALSALSRAIERAATDPSAATTVSRVRDRLPKLAAHDDARVRAAAVRLAGLAGDALPLEKMLAAATDPSPRVREAAVVALERLGRDEARAAAIEPTLVASLSDDDAVIQERAADALLQIGARTSLQAVLDYVIETADEAAAARVAERLTIPTDPKPFAKALGAALARLDHDHAAYETLLELKVRALEALRPRESIVPGPSVDQQIASLFPHWPQLSVVRGFVPLAKSLRTAEMLYGSHASADGDPSASIVLWTKSLEGYLHAWLSPRLASLQNRPGTLWELGERVGAAWPTYQRWIAPRWTDPVSVGAMSVDVPLRSTVNVLRDISERRSKPLDSPMSVTEWARLMMFLAIDHPSGAKNVLEVACRDPEHAIRLAHRLQVIALVRNSVTHRSVAATSPLDAFRPLYYGALEDVTRMA